MINKEKLDSYLALMRAILLSNSQYRNTYKAMLDIKIKQGSVYSQLSKTGILKLQARLEEDILDQRGLTILSIIQKITLTFSNVSGMTSEEWGELIDYLHIAYNRVIYPTADSIEISKRAVIRALRENPWGITLLLMELLHPALK